MAVQPIYPHMADLPKERVQGKVFLFKKTRVDYFGPFEVTVMRRPMKVSCCLLTPEQFT